MTTFQQLKGGKKRPLGIISDSGSRKIVRLDPGLQVYEDDGTKVADDPTKSGEQFWIVQWRNHQSKKHKTWEGDGVLVLSAGKGILYNMDGQILTSGKPSPDGATVGTFLELGNKEMEVDCGLSKAEYTSGRIFGRDQDNMESTIVNPEILKREKPSTPAPLNLRKKFTVPFKATTLNRQPAPSTQGDRYGRNIVELEPVKLIQEVSKDENVSVIESYWSAHWRRPQTKQHKTWDGDAYIIKNKDKLTMISDNGKLMGSVTWKGNSFSGGTSFTISMRTVEIDCKVTKRDVPRVIGIMPPDGPLLDDIGDLETPAPNDEFHTRSLTRPIDIIDEQDFSSEKPSTCETKGTDVQRKKFVVPTSIYNRPAPVSKAPVALHDPKNEGAIIMKEPNLEHQKKFNHKNRPVVPVVIDPILARHLRPHQVDGVKFMYECVMGLRRHEGQGCILADEMGMGKTLQTITLIWTLLKQNCYGGGGPAVGKALIVCPVSLIANWKKEIHKWLGRDRIGIMTGDKDKSTVKLFINSRKHQILIIGYEKLRSVISELQYCIPPIGLIICDEGHRLKSASNKTSTMFEALSTPRRIILSGTPIQNDLSEFHAMADFCNPGLLDGYPTFRKLFENPILKSRAPGCSEEEIALGETRHTQLQNVAKSFVLRREATILTNYLPPKHEYVVFVTPSTLQKSMFAKILQPDSLSSLLSGSMARSLAMIQLLTKLSTSPLLLKNAKRSYMDDTEGDSSDGKNSVEDALKLLPEDAKPENVELSGKLLALSKLLDYLREETEEKCILVSHYTSTLDVIESFCKRKRYTFLRLDGQTPVSRRQEFVDRFNKAPQKGAFLFLLSAKAGGVGLNLIGASRLCLIDSDWNPSHDLQSMARIHRDGQKRPVFIYRFLTAGTIDEKIYQRQVTKLGLSDSLMGNGSGDGGKSKSDSFTHKELRDLFTFHHRTICHTHDLLACSCAHDKELGRNVQAGQLLIDSDCDSDDQEMTQQHWGFRKASLHTTDDFSKVDKAATKRRKAELAALGEWNHINCLDPSTREGIMDNALQTIAYCPKQSDQSDFSISYDLELGSESEYEMLNNIPGGSICFLFEKSSDKLDS